MRRYLVWWSVGVALLANLMLFVPALPYLLRAIAAFLLSSALPGILMAEALLGGIRPKARAIPLWERVLYGLGIGYGAMVVVPLILSYLPGGLAQWQTLVAFDAVILSAAAWCLWRGTREDETEPTALNSLSRRSDATPREDDAFRTWVLVGILSVIVVGGFFRFSSIGYSEYQGDEARATARAAAVIQGSEDVLMLHRKGPTEILVPTAIFSLTGQLTEAGARFPFAFANTAALVVLFALGWRLFGPVAGWSAAMLLALDGYFIGFAHIVQYQSVVFLTTLLSVLVLHRLVAFRTAPTRILVTAAILMATALLSHYEGVWIFIPAAYLLGVYLWNEHRGEGRAERGETKTTLSTYFKMLVPPVIVGAVLIGLFYVPFILHPNFSATYTYLSDRRIGSSFPYNNLWDFFIRTTLYSTTYYALLMIIAGVIALWLAWRRGWGRTGQWVGLALIVIAAIVSFIPAVPPALVAAAWTLAIVGVWVSPHLSHTERWLWLWMGIPLIVAFFFTEKPRTHVYVFFMPWALLVGMVLQMGYAALVKRVGTPTSRMVAATTAVVVVALFGNYAYWYFAYNPTEILRTWNTNRPAGYITFYDKPDENALFGFPLANGWKVVGSLYEQGVISGEFESNEAEAWVPAWYTRGARRCARTADWFFQTDNLEPFGYNEQLAMEHYLRQGFQKWGTVEIYDQPRMVIWQRTDDPVTERTIPLSEMSGFFDQNATPHFPLEYPVVSPPAIANPLHVNFGNEIWLEGYDLHYDAPLNPGDTFTLTLYWRAQKPITNSYKVFNQVYFGDSGMQAQQDGYPVCEGRDTWRWDPGELITDVYTIQVKPDATPGLYPLYTGMYLEASGDRLMVLDDAGNQTDSQVQVTDIRIGKE